MAEWIIKDAPGVAQNTSSFAENPLVRGLGQLGIGAAQGIARTVELPGLIDQYLSGKTILPTTGISSKLKELQGQYLPESYQEPQGIGESFARNLGETIPLAAIAAASGGAALPIAASSLGSALGETGAQALGLGPVGEIAGSVVGGLSGSFLSKGVPALKAAKKAQDLLARAAIKPGEAGVAKEIGGALKQVEKQLTTETSKKTATKVRYALDKIYDQFTEKGINPVKAMDARKSLYRLGRELPSDLSTQYIKPLTEGINDFFAAYSAKNPTFWKHLNARDRLTELSHMHLLTQKFTKNLNKIPVFGELTKNAVDSIAGESERFARGILKSAPARQYYFDAVRAVVSNNPDTFVRNINKAAELLTPDQNESKESGGWIIK